MTNLPESEMPRPIPPQRSAPPRTDGTGSARPGPVAADSPEPAILRLALVVVAAMFLIAVVGFAVSRSVTDILQTMGLLLIAGIAFLVGILVSRRSRRQRVSGDDRADGRRSS